MQERIKELRKALKLTQAKFAERLGVKPNTISQYESGRNEPIDAVISLICREFGVNENWLRNGDGEKFIVPPKSQFDEVAKEFDLDDLDKRIMLGYMNLAKEDREVIKGFMRIAFDSQFELQPRKPLTNAEDHRLENATPDERKKAVENNEPVASAISQQPNNPTETVSVPKEEWEDMKRMLKEQQKQIDTINQEDAIRDLLEGKSNLSTLWSG